MCPESSVGLQREQGAGEHRERDQHQQAGDHRVPDEDRHPEHRHAGRAHADDRGDEVDRTEDGAETGHPQTHDPQVAADAGRAYGVRQRRVGEPAEVGGAGGGQEARAGDQATEQEQPVAEHVEPRERDVRRADLQRHQHVAEAEEQRRREQQQHDRAVHREQLVVDLVVDELHARVGQLRAHDQRHDAGDQEPGERRGQVELADHLVVGGGEDLDDRLAERATRGPHRGGGRRGGGGHSRTSLGRPERVRQTGLGLRRDAAEQRLVGDVALGLQGLQVGLVVGLGRRS